MFHRRTSRKKTFFDLLTRVLLYSTLWPGELITSETQLTFASSADPARRTQCRCALVVSFSLGNVLISFLLQPISIPATAAVVRRAGALCTELRMYVYTYRTHFSNHRLLLVLDLSLCRFGRTADIRDP